MISDSDCSSHLAGCVVLTGASGFVGGHVLRRLAESGYTVRCPVRSGSRLSDKTQGLAGGQVESFQIDLLDSDKLAEGITGAVAAVHLVGIIIEQQRAGQTFQRVHVEITSSMLRACRQAGVKRFVHVSALAARTDSPSRYHQTKWAAEQLVRQSGLDWTIFRPSLIHGPDGEFMQLMKQLTTGLLPPVLPCFGSGKARLQPVHVDNVAEMIVASLRMDQAIGQTYEVGGPERYTWKQLYRTCRQTIPGARRFKPIVGIPVWKAKLLGRLGDWHDRRFGSRRPLGLLPAIPFGHDQVLMSQEDNICDIEPIERTFDIKLRGFAKSLAGYADQL